jgi:hypothetical protein
MFTVDIRIGTKRLGVMSIYPIDKHIRPMDWEVKYTREPLMDEGKKFVQGEFTLRSTVPEVVIERALAEVAHMIVFNL